MFHISNNYVDLEPVLAAAAAADASPIAARDYRPDGPAAARRAAPSIWVAMSRSRSTLDRLRMSDPAAPWRPIHGRAGFSAWRDDYDSILPMLKGF